MTYSSVTEATTEDPEMIILAIGFEQGRKVRIYRSLIRSLDIYYCLRQGDKTDERG